jgi:hypothetical protein
VRGNRLGLPLYSKFRLEQSFFRDPF